MTRTCPTCGQNVKPSGCRAYLQIHYGDKTGTEFVCSLEDCHDGDHVALHAQTRKEVARWNTPIGPTVFE